MDQQTGNFRRRGEIKNNLLFSRLTSKKAILGSRNITRPAGVEPATLRMNPLLFPLS